MRCVVGIQSRKNPQPVERFKAERERCPSVAVFRVFHEPTLQLWRHFSGVCRVYRVLSRKNPQVEGVLLFWLLPIIAKSVAKVAKCKRRAHETRLSAAQPYRAARITARHAYRNADRRTSCAARRRQHGAVHRVLRLYVASLPYRAVSQAPHRVEQLNGATCPGTYHSPCAMRRSHKNSPRDHVFYILFWYLDIHMCSRRLIRHCRICLVSF